MSKSHLTKISYQHLQEENNRAAENDCFFENLRSNSSIDFAINREWIAWNNLHNFFQHICRAWSQKRNKIFVHDKEIIEKVQIKLKTHFSLVKWIEQ